MMAKKSVPPGTGPKIELAIDYHWINSSWDGNPLPGYLKAQLLRVDRCIAGAASIANILHRFAMGRADVESTGNGDDLQVVYPSFSAGDLDRMRIGLQELLDMAETTIENVRDDREGHVAASLKEQARG